MKLTVRWPRPSKRMRVLAGVVGALVVVFAPTSWSIVMVAAFVAYAVFGVTVQVTGGGFRPLRTLDLIEFNAADQLDAYDREQAAAMRR